MKQHDPPPPNDENQEQNSQEDLDSIESHSNSPLTNPELEKKGKYLETKQEKSMRKKRKKMKVDRNAMAIILDSEYVQLMTEAITEALQESVKTIEERHEEISGTITNFLKVLCKYVEDVKVVAHCSTPRTNPHDPFDTLEVEPT